ncbi:MAG TPA: hypothetical protein VGA61_17960 [Anaerolineae bacterium]
MRVVVCVKQIYDPLTVKISRSREEFDLRQATRKMNPADRAALEAGLRLRDAVGGDVIAVTVGDAAAEDAVREAVAMGADHGCLVLDEGPAGLHGAGVARALIAALQRVGPADLVLTGQGNPVDGTGSQAGRLAAILGCPVALDVVCLEATPAGGVQAVVAAGSQTDAVVLPAPAVAEIASVPDRPRYPTAQRIANVYQPGLVDICHPAELGLEPADLDPDIERGGLVLGPERTPGQILAGAADEVVDAVVGILRAERVI